MSSGQRPRWPAFFPRMKQRGRGRRRPAPFILWDVDPVTGRVAPVWPQVLRVGGQRLPLKGVTFSVRVMDETRRLDRATGYWETIDEAGKADR